MQQADSPGQKVGVLAFFLACSRIALTSFGSPPFWARRELVERQRWLTEQEFLELLALGQLLPGPNVLNVLVMLGYRFSGWAGAAAAVAGFLGWPFLIVIGLGMLYQRYGAFPLVHAALTGMSAVAAGLILATGVKMAAVLPSHWRPWLSVVLAFIGVGVLRWPLLAVLGALAPYALVTAWKEKD
jgi:chromate transporter